ncbi:UDP-N-acetylglucosamine 1-carboxyvinyltransferase [bacterium]|nr:UDP-N-acetylglucosamine 1-carboxyvinyltransferase [bacterium]
MARLVVQGGIPLHGRLEANGAKNAALPIMAAALLAKGPVTLRRVPNISDVWTLTGILKSMGCLVEYDGEGLMKLDTSTLTTTKAPDHLVRKMNASFDIMGPLLAAYGEGEVSLPGGCNLGSRPVDLHLAGFRKLGAEVTSQRGFVRANANKLRGAHILFPKVSVGATKNCLMAATVAEGETVLENCAREPEIVDLANFLVAMGAKIDGLGRQTMRVTGVEKLHGCDYSVVADRIEVGTYLVAGAITQGDVVIENCVPGHLESLLELLQEMGQDLEIGHDHIRIRGRSPIKPISVSTEPYPGFPTDLHPQLVALATLAKGTTTVTENIFNGRFMYAMELVRLGGDVRVSHRDVIIRGVKQLDGAPVDAPDIRAGGALVCAALAAHGESTISGVNFIDRGYQEIEKRLAVLGAKIVRADFED